MQVIPRDLIVRELAARELERKSIPDILEKSFSHQRKFILHKAKQKCLYCTRRSAKSFTAGLYMINEALHNPGCNVLFIGLTRESAKRIIWKDILHVINTRYNLGGVPNKADLTMTFPNGSVISVTGVDADQNEMNKLLGAKYRLVCIDEASMYTIDLSNLVYGVLGPAMVDPNDDDESGTICLMGTASNFPRGLFYDITTGKERGWELFQWTAHDNPFVAKKWAENLAKIEAERPEYMQTPQFKQWYLNLWVIDDEVLCYKFDMQRNLVKSLPHLSANGWTYILGADTGWNDKSTLCLTGYHINDPHCYIIKSFRESKLTFDQFADEIKDNWTNTQHSPSKYFIDGSNKQGVESMRQRTQIPFENADKRDKATFIDLCSSDLMAGKIKILDTPENRPLWEQMSHLVWTTNAAGKVVHPKKEHPSLPNDDCDAMLYSWRNGYHYTATPAPKKIIVGSREWYAQQADQIWEREREYLEHRQEWAEEGSLGELG